MLNYKHKKSPIVPFKTHISSVEPIKIVSNEPKIINFAQDFKFENFENQNESPQILIIGQDEHNTLEILKMVIEKLSTLVNTSNTTVYKQDNIPNNKYNLKSKITSYAKLTSHTIDEILAFQMDTPDDLYSNKWQNFDTCINIFDRCFSESEYEIIYKHQFDKIFKYSNHYKIINIIILNYMYDNVANNLEKSYIFDYIFCTHDKYLTNVNKISKIFSTCDSKNFYELFNKYSTHESAIVIQKNKNLYEIFKLKYDFLTQIDKNKINSENCDIKKRKLICGNDQFFPPCEVKSVTI